MSADKLIMQLGKLEGAIDSVKTLHDAGNYVRGEAVMRAPVGLSGDLRNSIQLRSGEEDGLPYVDVYTNKEYAHYVEFGTGPKGATEHYGVSPEVTVAYKTEPWWIHESQLDVGVAEMYGWFHIDTPDGRFYRCYGQYAQPFLYPALKDNERTVLDIMKGGYEEAIRRAVR